MGKISGFPLADNMFFGCNAENYAEMPQIFTLYTYTRPIMQHLLSNAYTDLCPHHCPYYVSSDTCDVFNNAECVRKCGYKSVYAFSHAYNACNNTFLPLDASNVLRNAFLLSFAKVMSFFCLFQIW